MNLRSLLGGVLNSVVLIGPLAHVVQAYCAEAPFDQQPAPLASVAPSVIQAPTNDAALPPLRNPSPSENDSDLVTENEAPTDGKTHAMVAAVADGVTTGMALSAGAIESNPLIVTSPAGLVAVTGLKLGMVSYADTLPKEEKRFALKSTSAVWGGAAVNNIMIFLAAPPPIPVLAGLVTGILTWTHLENQYEKEDIRLAAKNSQLATIKAEAAVQAPEKVETSGE